jgi:hypothetical protein
MRLIIQLHPHQYPTNLIQFGFISTLLSSMVLVWFAHLWEHHSPLFNNFKTFLEEFNATFGDLDKERMSSTKI